MLRPATETDKESVRVWRNHPEVRAVSLTQHEISPDEHESWWAATMDDPTRRVLIYERGGTPAGVVSLFDYDEQAGSAWWGYYLDNDTLTARGELLPAWIQIQREAIKYFDAMGITQLDAEVLESNEGVRSFNTRMGFVEVGRDERDLGSQTVPVLHVRRTTTTKESQ